MSNIKNENAELKKENLELNSKIDNIDKKFDKIMEENKKLKDYFMIKSDNLDIMQSHLIDFKKNLKENKFPLKEKNLNDDTGKIYKQIKTNINNKASSIKNEKKNHLNLKSASNNLLNSMNCNNKSNIPRCLFDDLKKKISTNKNNLNNQSTNKLYSKLKLRYNNTIMKKDEINDLGKFLINLESLNYSEYIENPKEIFYFPQKASKPPINIPKIIPKLDFQRQIERVRNKSELLIELFNNSKQELISPNILNHANNESINSMEKNVNINSLNTVNKSNDI